MKILLTAFEPFGNFKTNSSEEVLKLFPTDFQGFTIIKQLVPVSFRSCAESVIEAIKKETPDIVLCLGQRSSYDGICVERIAINCMDAKNPDNEGSCPNNEKVIIDGENAYFSTLPIKQIVSAIEDVGIPCKISNTAGTYVCNALMYSILHFAKTKNDVLMAGFIHLPTIDKMKIEIMVEAVKVSMRCFCQTDMRKF